MKLRSIMQSNYWRVQMAWPDSNPRYFGKFHSRTEAEKWIAEHQWLTKHVWAEDCSVRRNFNCESGVVDMPRSSLQVSLPNKTTSTPIFSSGQRAWANFACIKFGVLRSFASQGSASLANILRCLLPHTQRLDNGRRALADAVKNIG